MIEIWIKKNSLKFETVSQWREGDLLRESYRGRLTQAERIILRMPLFFMPKNFAEASFAKFLSIKKPKANAFGFACGVREI
jgi:hypothetical protein